MIRIELNYIVEQLKELAQDNTQNNSQSSQATQKSGSKETLSTTGSAQSHSKEFDDHRTPENIVSSGTHTSSKEPAQVPSK